MKMRRLCGLVLMLFTANAAPAGWSAQQPPSYLHVYEGHGGVFVAQPTMVNPDSCTRGDQYLLRQTHPQFKELYAMLLSARVADRNLYFHLSGCVEGFPSISHIYF
jgi:hypothetical protein